MTLSPEGDRGRRSWLAVPALEASARRPEQAEGLAEAGLRRRAGSADRPRRDRRLLRLLRPTAVALYWSKMLEDPRNGVRLCMHYGVSRSAAVASPLVLVGGGRSFSHRVGLHAVAHCSKSVLISRCRRSVRPLFCRIVKRRRDDERPRASSWPTRAAALRHRHADHVAGPARDRLQDQGAACVVPDETTVTECRHDRPRRTAQQMEPGGTYLMTHLFLGHLLQMSQTQAGSASHARPDRIVLPQRARRWGNIRCSSRLPSGAAAPSELQPGTQLARRAGGRSDGETVDDVHRFSLLEAPTLGERPIRARRWRRRRFAVLPPRRRARRLVRRKASRRRRASASSRATRRSRESITSAVGAGIARARLRRIIARRWRGEEALAEALGDAVDYDPRRPAVRRRLALSGVDGA